MPDEQAKPGEPTKKDAAALSQEEINAMLSGLDADEPEPEVTARAEAAAKAAEAPSANAGALSQDEINAMLAGISDEPDLPVKPKPVTESEAVGLLSPKDRLAAGELINLAFSAAATSLSSQLGSPVESDLPQVREMNALQPGWVLPFAGKTSLMLIVSYGPKETDSTIVLLPVDEVRAIVQSLAPDTPVSPPGEALNDAENKVFSTMATTLCAAISSSLSAMLPDSVSIAPPDILIYSEDMLPVVMPSLETDAFITIDLALHFQSGIPLQVHQLWPSVEAKAQVERLMSGKSRPAPQVTVSPAVVATGAVAAAMAPQMAMAGAAPGPSGGGGYSASPPAAAPPHPGVLGGGYASPPHGPVSVQPVQFTPFDQQPSLYANPNTNLDLVMDITLNMTVELGKTEISIKEVLELTRGSVIELDRIAGEPVDLLANGKLIAKGEVVVIEDSFGLRITSIVSPAERLRSI